MNILMADDDLDDQLIASIAFKRLNLAHSLDFVDDGQELMDYLYEKINLIQSLPDLILLDFNMPKKDGRMALEEIKNHLKLQHLSVIIFSTSNSEKDMNYALSKGAEKYIVKPFRYEDLVEIFRTISEDLESKPGWRYSITS